MNLFVAQYQTLSVKPVAIFGSNSNPHGKGHLGSDALRVCSHWHETETDKMGLKPIVIGHCLGHLHKIPFFISLGLCLSLVAYEIL